MELGAHAGTQGPEGLSVHQLHRTRLRWQRSGAGTHKVLASAYACRAQTTPPLPSNTPCTKRSALKNTPCMCGISLCTR
jgi:hypothetical protein